MNDDLVVRINQARRDGFSEDEIVGVLAEQNPQISTAVKQGFTPQEILGEIAPLPQGMERVERNVASLARGATPTASLMATGALAGAPFGPAGAATGALIGGLAIPGADALVSAYNEMFPKDKVELPSVAIGRVLDKMGMVQPRTREERVMETVGGALTGAAGQVKTGQILGQVGTPTQRVIGQEVARAPTAQMIAAPPAAAAAQVTGEVTGSPLAAMLAGTATGAATGVRTPKREIAPTATDLRVKASQAYQRASDAGVLIKPESLEAIGTKIVGDVSKRVVIDPEVDTQAMAVIRRLQKTFEEPQTIEQLDLTRQFIRDAQKAGGRDAKFAKEALKQFDDYIEKIDAKDIVAGDSKRALAELNAARDLWKRSQKTQVIEDMFNSAEVRAVSYSQSGLENALRRQLINLADSEDIKFFSKAEQQAIRAAAKGGNLQNFLRWAGKLSPSSVVAGAGGAYLGAQAFGPAGAIIAPIAGGASKYAATQMGLRGFRDLQDMIALGRQPEVLRAPFAAVQPTTLRGLLSSQYTTE